MANRISMGEKEAIIRLFENGWKKRRIARELGLDRNTVRSHIRAFELSNSPIMPAGNIGAQTRMGASGSRLHNSHLAVKQKRIFRPN